jgi:hypothetical protein
LDYGCSGLTGAVLLGARQAGNAFGSTGNENVNTWLLLKLQVRAWINTIGNGDALLGTVSSNSILLLRFGGSGILNESFDDAIKTYLDGEKI